MDKKPSKIGRVISTLLLLFVLLGSAVAVALALAVARMDGPTELMNEKAAVFTVEPGKNANAIGRSLRESGLIRSEDFFRFVLKVKNLGSALKAGTYYLPAASKTSDIIDILVTGRQKLVRVSIPEGTGLRSVAQAAEAAGIATADEFMKAAVDPDFLERLGVPGSSFLGWLYPDTYFLPPNAGAEALIALMVATFREKIAAIAPESKGLSSSELQRYVIMASIIEREYRLPEEAPLMASVFWNRLRIGMALQSCATVVYVITERMGKSHPQRLFDRDLQLEDPFNTYRQPGLPPAPISNPGATALHASFNPTPSRNLYFRLVDEKTGKHYFSETLDEHNRAASLFVKPRS